MKNVGYYNGKMGLMEELSVPFLDRGMFFGDGVYDATYAANRKIFETDFHVDRFYNSLKAVKINLEFSKPQLIAELQKCIDAMDSDGVVFVYWQATRGTAIRNHVFPENVPPNLLIYVIESSLTDLRIPKKAITVEDTRFLHCNIKTLNLLPSVMASQQAKEAGCSEVIFHRGERVTECAHSNVNILKDGVFITPPLDNLILPGTTRRHYLEICERLGVPFEERTFTLSELFDADEIMITSAGTLGMTVCEVDGKRTGGKDPELLHKLQRAAVDDFTLETGFVPDIL
ncbi:MAG: aminotransferase class IV [Treponema sp.]